MDPTPAQTRPNSAPLGRAFQLAELPGFFNKWLDVPPTRLGILVDAHNQVRRLPTGRSRVLSFFERLQGRAAGLRAGYLPGGPFTAWVQADALLSGDEVLLDATLVGRVEILDPGRFFLEVVAPRGELRGAGLELDSEQAFQALRALARRYAAGDLVHGLPNQLLQPSLAAGLAPALDLLGLRLESLQLIAFCRADDRALVAEKLQALRERLQNVALDEKMAQAESEYMLEDFLHQLDPTLEETAGLRPLAAPAQRATWLASLRAWLAEVTAAGRLRWPWRISLMAAQADPQTRLDQLTGGDRAQVDALVRQQCTQDLQHANTMLNDLRGRVYRAGDIDLALHLKTLERKFEQAADAVQNPQFGCAPYLGELKLSHDVLVNMFNYDEVLLVRSAALADDILVLQQKQAAGELHQAMAGRLEASLDAFTHAFETRSRVVKPDPEAQQPYRTQP